MDELEPIADIGVALAVGLLIGIERQQSHASEGTLAHLIGGIRTLPLVAFLGCLSVLAGRAVGPWLVVAGFGAIALLVAVSYADDVRRDRDRGLTSEIVFLLTYTLGAFAATTGVVEPVGHRAIFTAGVAVVMTMLLSAKPRLHAFVLGTSRDDVFAAVKFLIVAVVVLPLLPNRSLGPFDAINPFNVGLMIALIAAVSFVGYVAVRVLGSRRGIAVTSFVGGLVSSTAVTLSFAGRARKQPSLAPACALAVTVASSVMFLRILAVVAVANPALARSLFVPMLAMAAAGATFSFVLQRRLAEEPADSSVEVSNPFELAVAFKFGLIFAVVLFAAKAAHARFGSGGVYVTGVLAGATDVDAITLATASLARKGLPETVATTTIMLAAASNSVAKATIAAVIGGRPLARRVLPCFAAMLMAGAVALGLLWLTSTGSAFAGANMDTR